MKAGLTGGREVKLGGAIYHLLSSARKPSTWPFPQLDIPDVGLLHQLKMYFESRDGDKAKVFPWSLLNPCTAAGSGAAVGSGPYGNKMCR